MFKNYSNYGIGNEVKFSTSCIKTMAQKLLDIYDINRSGFLEENEILDMMKDTYHCNNINSPEIDHNDVGGYLKLYDIDGDNKIGINDIIYQMEKLYGSNYDINAYNFYSSNLEDEPIKTVQNNTIKKDYFNDFDNNKTEYLERDDIIKIIKTAHSELNKTDDIVINDDVINSFIQIMDLDGDGRVSKYEYNKFIEKESLKRNINY